MRSLLTHLNYNRKNFTFFSSGIRINEKNIIFGDKKVKKSDFYKKKKVIQIDDVDVHKILVSKKEPYGTNKSTKYFIGYNDDDVIKPLYIKLLQMDMLNDLIVVKQCLSRLLAISY